MDSPAIDQILARYYNVPVLPIPSTVSPGGGESIVPSQSNSNPNDKSKSNSELKPESESKTEPEPETVTVNLEENVIVKPEFKTPNPVSVEDIASSDDESDPGKLDTTFNQPDSPVVATPGRTRQSRQPKISRLKSPQTVRRPRGGSSGKSSGKSHENCTPPRGGLPQRVKPKGKTPAGSKVPKANFGGKGK